MEYKPLTDMTYLATLVLNDKTNVLEIDKIYELLGKHFVFGYEILVDGERKGVSFAMCYDGIYTVDGYNENVPFFTASQAGKLVCQELKKYTNVAYTQHSIKEKALTLLAKRVGFKEDKITLKMEL